MLVFDSFPDRDSAEVFALRAHTRFGLQATVYDSQAESDQVDPFPFQLKPPIVLVTRPAGVARKLIEEARRYGGNFAGT